jgi:hypothetical protein
MSTKKSKTVLLQNDVWEDLEVPEENKNARNVIKRIDVGCHSNKLVEDKGRLKNNDLVDFQEAAHNSNNVIAVISYPNKIATKFQLKGRAFRSKAKSIPLKFMENWMHRRDKINMFDSTEVLQELRGREWNFNSNWEGDFSYKWELSNSHKIIPIWRADESRDYKNSQQNDSSSSL